MMMTKRYGNYSDCKKLALISHGSVSVFNVGIGIWIFLSVFFSSRFGIRYFKISRYSVWYFSWPALRAR